MGASEGTRRERERIVREHMEAENALEMDRALATFSHPRYEIIATGEIYDGAEEVARYYRESRAVFPDQRNELISLRHADDAVIVEFWLLGTHKGPFGRLEPAGRDFKCCRRRSSFSRERTWCASVFTSIQQRFAASSRVRHEHQTHLEFVWYFFGVLGVDSFITSWGKYTLTTRNL